MSDAFVAGPYALENQIVTACDGRLSICEVHDHSDTSEDHDSREAHATGVLLAASWTMLQALDHVLKQLDVAYDQTPGVVDLKLIADAISRATDLHPTAL